MSLLSFCSNTFKNINSYYSIAHKTNEKKVFDIESQKYEIKNLVDFDQKNESEYNKFNNILDDTLMDKEIIIPIGMGFDSSINLKWRRKTNYSDYEVKYKGFHIISYKKIQEIVSTHNEEKYARLENILKLYIDNGYDMEQTIIHLHL